MNNSQFTRREFMQRGVACGAAALAAQQLLGQSASAAVPATTPATSAAATSRPAAAIPMLYWTGEREASLSWPVAELARGWVEFGATPELGKKSIAGEDVADFLEGFSATALQSAARAAAGDRADADPHVLRARLKELTSGQRVYYRVHTQAVENGTVIVGDVRHFTLPDGRSKQAKIVVWNDTHDHQDTVRSLFTLTGREPSDLLVWNGDGSNNIDRENQIVPMYLSPAGGLDITQERPMVFSRGNHDVRGAMAVRLGHYSAMRTSYYSFRIGPVAAIVLEAGEDKPDNHPTFQGRPAFEPFLKKEAQWLAEEIKRPGIADAPYRILICHIPLRWRDESTPDYAKTGYDAFSLRGRTLWHESLVKWKIQVVISGHTHENHFMPADAAFPYAQLVGGGPLASNACLLRLDADGKSLAIRVLDLTGKVLRQETFSPI